MKMGATIECPSLPLDNNNDPFGIVSEDPLKRAVGGFGVEQHSENLTEEYIMELVKEKINDMEIDLENPAIAIEEIVEYLEGEGVEVSKDLRNYIKIIAVSTKVNFLENLERAKDKGTIEMALADSKWMKEIAEYITENRNDPEKIKIFWQQYDSFFLKFEEQNEKDLFSDKRERDTRRGPEITKRGILAEIAAMDLLKEMAENIKGCRNAKIEVSTEEDDVGEQIDFFLTITMRDKKINATLKIPVQVKSCNLSSFAGKKAPAEKVEFVFKNMINTEGTREETKYNLKYSYQEIIKEKIENFFNENKNTKGKGHSDGIFIILPYGKLNPEMFDYKFDFGRNKKRRNKKSEKPELVDCIEENGVPNKALKEYFLSEAKVTRNMETRIKEIFRRKQIGR